MVLKQKTTYDWEAIYRDYRPGVLSIREIARQHCCSEGAIRKKAKLERWERDLAKKVKEEVRNKLVRTGVRTDSPQTEKEIIEQAAATQVDVIRSHHKRIGSGSETVELLMSQLKQSAITREELEEWIKSETKEDATPKRRTLMMKAVSLPQHASTVLNLTTALKNLIVLERQAFGMDEEEGGKSYEDMLQELE